jgi:hypothetical protein
MGKSYKSKTAQHFTLSLLGKKSQKIRILSKSIVLLQNRTFAKDTGKMLGIGPKVAQK